MNKLKVIEKKDKLNTIKQNIDKNIIKCANAMYLIFNDLYLINKEKLYLYDQCDSITKFIRKNKYSEKLDLAVNTVISYYYSYNYGMNKNLTANDIEKIGFQKLQIFSCNKEINANTILRLSEMSCIDIKEEIGYLKDTQTGRFVKSGREFKRRENTKMANWMIEIPKNNYKKFETDFIKICADYDVRII